MWDAPLVCIEHKYSFCGIVLYPPRVIVTLHSVFGRVVAGEPPVLRLRYILNSLHNKRYEMYFKTVTGADSAGIRPIIGAQKVFEM